MLHDNQWGSQRGDLGGSNLPIEKCQQISADKTVENTQSWFARVKASSNDIININRFANFGL